MQSIYLDNAATTKLSPEVKEYLISILDVYANPSSLYQSGQKSHQIVEQARNSIAKFINADPLEIIFTSGGSASNTLAINGFAKNALCSLLYSPIAHKSILKTIEYVKKYTVNSVKLKVDNKGVIDAHYLKKQLSNNFKPFVVLNYADSEIGTIQDVKKIINLVHSYNGTVYLDCTGSISTIPLDVRELDIDMIGFSAHKLGGLKGCGVLYKKSNIELEPLIYGTQEQGLFAGTENILGIASIGKVVEDYDYSSINSNNRDYVWNYINENVPNTYLVGTPIGCNRLPHNLYICVKGIEGESLMFLLDMNGIQVSTGSACNRVYLEPSPTLNAIGMNEKDIHSCIRLSFSGTESKYELDYVCIKFRECIEKLRRLNT